MALAERLGLVVPLVLPQVTAAEILLEGGGWSEARAVLDAVRDRVWQHDLGAS
ncbi:MAG: hypothetical protein QN152_09270 [Armatimonadota bacterium]|nr:hypothetical protein [Armatimonadota bacterium]MDR7427785.1 hypothetical protein [Armatimonadota bacterium]MDR7464027.1 hypothetical protein [Armatimonadota bacterium]MDR7468911.1 hypothetical protein [Armatimonadota bacterium]MDR7474848.1 hypothetical protein [Armatimonadota bacterium]